MPTDRQNTEAEQRVVPAGGTGSADRDADVIADTQRASATLRFLAPYVGSVVAGHWTVMTRNTFVVALVVGALMGSPRTSQAEATAATADLRVSLQASSSELEPGDTVLLTAVLGNSGDFGIDSAVVSLTIPAGLTIVSVYASDGTSFDPGTGTWTTGALYSYEAQTLEVTVEASAAPAPLTVIAELMSFEASFGAWDRDSTPGNGNPCEDDYASVTLTIRATGDPDAGPSDPPPNCTPDAGVAQPRPDASITDGGGAAVDGDDIGCACRSSDDASAPALLVILFAAFVATRGRR